MLKFIIISVLVIYLIFKVTSFAFKLLFGAAYEQQKRAQQGQRQRYTTKRKAPNSNLNIDTPQQDKGKSGNDFKGGDYVDYEEVKD